MKNIKGIERISPRYYEDLEKVLANIALVKDDVTKLVAIGSTLDAEEEDIGFNDELIVAAYLNDSKTYSEDECYTVCETLATKVKIVHVLWSTKYAGNVNFEHDLKTGVVLYEKE